MCGSEGAICSGARVSATWKGLSGSGERSLLLGRALDLVGDDVRPSVYSAGPLMPYLEAPEWGRLLEPAIAERYQSRTRGELRDLGR